MSFDHANSEYHPDWNALGSSPRTQRPIGVGDSVVGRSSKCYSDRVFQTLVRRREKLAKSPSVQRAGVTPLTIAAGAVLERNRKRALKAVRTRLAEILDEIAEAPEIRASSAAIFRLCGDQLVAEAVHNFVAGVGSHVKVSRDEKRIISHVAQTGQPYICDETLAGDQYYFPDDPFTRSELAVPVIWKDKVLGVVNVESRRPYGFDRVSRVSLESRVRACIPLLLWLQLRTHDAFASCPWYPDVHGSDLSGLLADVCRAVCAELGDSFTKCTIWRANWEKDECWAYATAGMNSRYRRLMAMPLSSSRIGAFLSCNSTETAVFDWNDQTKSNEAERDRVLSLGIEKEFVSTILDPENPGMPLGAVTICFGGSDANVSRELAARLVGRALGSLSALLAPVIVAYRNMRLAIAETLFSLVPLATEVISARRRLEAWFEIAREFLNSPGGSVFLWNESSRRYTCAATTGFRHPEYPEMRDGMAIDRDYDPDDARSATMKAARKSGRALSENQVPMIVDPFAAYGEVGWREGMRHIEYLPADNYLDAEDEYRRLLACSTGPIGTPSGVVRFVRSEKSFPFSRCDERFVEVLCQEAARLLEEASLALSVGDFWERTPATTEGANL